MEIWTGIFFRWQGTPKTRLNINRKRILFSKNVEKQRERDKRNEIFCWKRSKQNENGKNETSINKHIFEEKRETTTRKEKQGDTPKEK